MENEIQSFNFDNQKVRTLIINDQPYFVGKDIATILNYANTQRSINQHVDEVDRRGY